MKAARCQCSALQPAITRLLAPLQLAILCNVGLVLLCTVLFAGRGTGSQGSTAILSSESGGEVPSAFSLKTQEYQHEQQYFHHLYGTSNRSQADPGSIACSPKDWDNSFWLADGNRAKEGEHLFASSEAQSLIWQQQFPTNCTSQKFFLYASDGLGAHGIGSTLHVATWALAKAIDMGRVLVFAPTPDGPWSQGRFCASHNNMNDCYFEPSSSCTYLNVVQTLAWKDIPDFDQNAQQDHLRLIKYEIEQPIADSSLVPRQLTHLLQSSPVPKERMYFWFRAQAIAFIVRPNARTLLQLQERKRQQAWAGLPDGAISIHVRHGDKGKEMPLVPDADYVARAEELLSLYPNLQRIIFLSTEDPQTVQYFKQLQNWTVLTMDVSRPKDEVVSPVDFAKRIGADEEFLNSLVNLDLALECSAWVGTIRSNWNRLIEELRSTVRCKAHLPYVDAGSGWDLPRYDW